MRYFPTALEVWIANLYKRLGMLTPYELSEETIAQHFQIYIYHKPLPSTSYESGKFKSITLDQRLPVEVQREAFYHELCHILRHAGWQMGMMPQAFKELQEWDAKRFTSYAAIPIHMLKDIDLKQDNIISYLSETFKVTPGLCEKRLERIYQQAKVG